MTYLEKIKQLAVTEIETPQIRAYVLRFLNEQAPKYFATAPASSSGKHHPPYVNCEEGLAKHTLAAAKLAKHVSSLEFLGFSRRVQDRIIAASILHDTMKFGVNDEPEVHTLADHAWLAADAVDANDADRAAIAKMIRSHAGQWGPSKPAGLAEFIVHLCDYLASRKDVTIDV